MTRGARFALPVLLLGCIDVGKIRAPAAGNPGPSNTDGAAKDGPPGDLAPRSVPLGAACNGNPDCQTGTCVDGVCCADPSCPTCQACGASGRCQKVQAGAVDPHFRCHPTDLPATCGRSGTCDGAGSCAFYPPGLECRPGVCQGASVVDALACNGAGQCLPAPARICAPFACDAATGACHDRCSGDTQCAPPSVCVGGSCGLKPRGSRCSADRDCASASCSEGICCDRACTGPCRSCSLPLREGTCTDVETGRPDPRGICRDAGSVTCGETGLCNGSGGCLLYGASTACMHACAADRSSLTTHLCDGAGTCGSATVDTPCPNSVCDPMTAACE